MIIKSLELKNYRNYKDLYLNLDKGTSLLYGDNAQGKTNILEAIYMSATAKSHRGSKDKEVINFDEEEAHIKIYIEKREVNHRIDIHLRKNHAKGIAIDGIPIRKINDLFGMLNVVFFSPEDLNIIKRGPADRRRFIDMELCQLSKIYVDNLINYNKILAQRNKLLKDISFNVDKKELLQSLDIWDIQLIHYGSEVIKYRKDFIAKLNIYIKDIHSSITGEKESLYINYDLNIDIDQYEKAVLKTRDNDIKYKMTSVGPHRDDISFFIKNSGKDIDLKFYGSQGQQRTAALSLKLAEIELVKKSINDYPILLLDDVFSELDVSRQKRLIKSIKHLQTIITSTGIDDLLNKNFSIDNIMQVKEAQVSSVKEFTKII